VTLLILDRDGVINHDSHQYIRTPAEWIPISGSIEAIAALSKHGYQVAIATNQSGLSRGYFTLDTLEEIHAELCRLVEAAGGSIAGIFYCPHLPAEGCNCRKPNTGLLQAIERELGESAKNAYFVGDSLKDLQAAQAYGCQPVLVRTGKGVATEVQLNSGETAIASLKNTAIYNDLQQASLAILESASR
jgi:D-glycero-D-manno-heptose 1,7-bisphosphate phosphatase